MSQQDRLRFIRIDDLIPLAVLLACLTPRFLSFMKVNIGFNLSFYSISVVMLAVLTHSITRCKVQIGINMLFLPCLAIVTIMSIGRALDFNGWMQHLIYVSTSVLMMLLLCHCGTSSVFDRCIFVIAVAATIHAFIGLYEVSSHHYLFSVGNFSQRLHERAAVSIFYNPNDYSMFLSTAFPLVVYSFINEKRVVAKLLFGITIPLSLYLIFAAGSRAALISILCITVLYFSLVLKSKSGTVALLVLVTALVLSYTLVPQFSQQVNSFLGAISIDLDSTSDTTRINLIRNGLYFLKESHYFGVGPGNLKQWFETRSLYSIGRIRYMHNWYVELLVTFGIPVFVAYLAFHFNLFRGMARSIQNENPENMRTMLLLMSFVVFSISSISSSSNVYSEWFWMYLAFCASYVESLRRTALENR